MDVMVVEPLEKGAAEIITETDDLLTQMIHRTAKHVNMDSKRWLRYNSRSGHLERRTPSESLLTGGHTSARSRHLKSRSTMEDAKHVVDVADSVLVEAQEIPNTHTQTSSSLSAVEEAVQVETAFPKRAAKRSTQASVTNTAAPTSDKQSIPLDKSLRSMSSPELSILKKAVQVEVHALRKRAAQASVANKATLASDKLSMPLNKKGSLTKAKAKALAKTVPEPAGELEVGQVAQEVPPAEAAHVTQEVNAVAQETAAGVDPEAALDDAQSAAV
jgi:hypothetical protein